MPGVEAITDSMVLVPVPVVWFGGLQLPDTDTKKPSDPAVNRTGTIITGTDLNVGAYPHQAQVHASRKRYSGRQRQELATVVWRL